MLRDGDTSAAYTSPYDLLNHGKHIYSTKRHEHKELGQYLSKRYASLFKENGVYHPENIYVSCSHHKTTLTNAANFMQDMIFNEQAAKNVKIHTISDKSDYLIDFNRPCAFYETCLGKLKSLESQKINKRTRTLIKLIEKQTGLAINNHQNVWRLHDQTLSQNINRSL